MVRPLAGDAAKCLGLRKPGWMAEEVSNDCCRQSWFRERIGLGRSDGGRAIRALLSRSFKLRITAHDELATLVHAHHAMMLTVAAATRR